MSASYPRQFHVPNYSSMSEQEQRELWKTLRDAMKSRGIIEVQFRSIGSASRLRRAVYEHFGGYEITFHRLTSQSAHILVGPEKIRTTSVEAKPFTGTLDVPELKRYREVPADFAPEHSKVCKVCGKRLPLENFGKRSSKGQWRQSYCISCMRIYSKWRGMILSTYGLERITPTISEGHRKRNEAFHEWYRSHQEGLEP